MNTKVLPLGSMIVGGKSQPIFAGDVPALIKERDALCIELAALRSALIALEATGTFALGGNIGTEKMKAAIKQARIAMNQVQP